MALPLGLLLGLGFGFEGLSRASASRRAAQQQEGQQLAIQNLMSNILPENQGIVGSGLEAITAFGGDPTQTIQNIINRRTTPAPTPEPRAGSFQTIEDPVTGELRRVLFDPVSGRMIADVGAAPAQQPLVQVNNNAGRDLPAAQAVQLGEAVGNVQNTENLINDYDPSFSNLGVDMLGGLGAGLEQTIDRVSGRNPERTTFWNNIETDKVKFVKSAFGGNASDADRRIIESIYPNPRFDDATNQALLNNLKGNKQQILDNLRRGLQSGGFDLGDQGQPVAPTVDFDLTQ